MPLQAQINFPVKKLTAKKKNSENSARQSQSAKRALFGRVQPETSPKKARFDDENGCKKPSENVSTSPRTVSALAKAKHAFHTGVPTRLIGRSKEISDIHCFLSEHINKRTSASLYMSGAPGTGKTSCLTYVLKNFEKKYQYAFINCMSVSTPAAIYKTIATELRLSTKVVNSKNIVESLKKHISSSLSSVILVLDEIDQLDCKGQQVLYNLFEWPHLPQSSLILIGIANALDLTDRILPRLHTFQCQPKLMHFLPYTKEQIVSILEDRLSEVQTSESQIIHPVAIQLCARKIAANTGDIRKALDVCRRAIEVVENKVSKQSALKSTSDDRCNPGSPMKRTSAVQQVDLQAISTVLHEVYGSRLQTSCLTTDSQSVTMPLQHMVLLCTLVLLKKYGKLQDMNMGKAYDVYKRICTKRNINVVDECSFHGLCKLVESRGFLLLKPSKIARMTKIVLKIDENEAEHVMQDKALLPSILNDSSVLGK